jgi:REP element-mobilizing transposase RayT
MPKLNHAENPVQFYTATILEWKKLLKRDKYKQIIIDSLAFLAGENRVKIFGFVIMDNHIHLIWQGTDLYSLKHTQLSFMKFTAQQIKFDLEKHHPDELYQFYVEAKDRKIQIWERNALCVDIMSYNVFVQKLNYIHKNPVRANLCESETDYLYSSAKHYQELEHPYRFIEFFNRGMW